MSTSSWNLSVPGGVKPETPRRRGMARQHLHRSAQGTHLGGKQGIDVMPGPELGASGQRCQHVLFVWDLKAEARGN